MKTPSRSARWLFFWLALAPIAGLCWREVLHRRQESPNVAFGESRKFQTVVIDPGHGGLDTGALGKGLREKDLTLNVALKLARLLRAEGFRVVLTREKDAFVSLGDRVQIANAERNSIFVSIHFNQTENASADGIETYLASEKSVGRRESFFKILNTGASPENDRLDEALALFLQEELVNTTRAKDRGVKQRNFYVIRHVATPAVLIEGGFVSHSRAASRLHQDAYLERLAEALARGIYKYREGKSGTQIFLAKRSE